MTPLSGLSSIFGLQIRSDSGSPQIRHLSVFPIDKND